MTKYGFNQPFRDLADVEKFEETAESHWLESGTVYEAFRQTATQFSEKTALIALPFGDPLAEGRHITYGEFLGSVNQAANLFLKSGLEAGETVTHLLPQTPEGFYALLGAEAVGIVNTVNPLLEAEHILGIMKAAKSRIIVAPGPDANAEIWEKVAYVIEHLPDLKAVFLLGAGAGCDGSFIQSFTDAMQDQSSDMIADLPSRGLDDVVGYYHTGGTTGVPKLVPHTNRMQLMQCAATGYIVGYTDADRMVAGLPLFHISGSIVGGLVPLMNGATLVIASPLGYRDPLVVSNYWRLIDKYKITILGAVPTVVSALLNIPVGECDISSLRIGITGGSGSPLEVLNEISEKSGVPMLEGYGMTETTSYTTLMPRDGELRFGSIGLREPYAHIKAAILDEDGAYIRDANVDEVGVILMKGTVVMPGYIQQEHNKEAFPQEGWLNSGDLGRIDAEGYIWLTGRSKDLIIRSGHNIDPALIEEPLHEHPSVELAAAVGMPDSYTGEMPVAFVQLKPGMGATADELKEFVRGKITERAANPAEIFIIETMPLTGVGKIFKPALREQSALNVVRTVIKDVVGEAAGIEVEMGSHPKFGMTAFLKNTSGQDITTLSKRLGEFTFHHEVS